MRDCLVPLPGDIVRALGEGVNLDPTTQAFVYATAFITSVAFAISVLNVLAVVLSHVLS
jgi:hypothetical protein